MNEYEKLRHAPIFDANGDLSPETEGERLRSELQKKVCEIFMLENFIETLTELAKEDNVTEIMGLLGQGYPKYTTKVIPELA